MSSTMFPIFLIVFTSLLNFTTAWQLKVSSYSIDSTCKDQNFAGTILYKTDQCFSSNNDRYFTYYCDKDQIYSKKGCIGFTCTGDCSEVVYLSSNCTSLGVDETGRLNFGRAECVGDNYTLPKVQMNETFTNLTTNCQEVYGQSLMNNNCVNGQRMSRRYSCRDFSASIIDYDSDNCTGNILMTRSSSFLSCSQTGTMYSTVSQCSTLLTQAPSSSNISADYSYDSRCSNNSTIGGKMLFMTDTIFSGFPAMYICNGSKMIIRRCSNVNPLLDCSDSYIYPPDCSTSFTDQNQNRFYLTNIKCENIKHKTYSHFKIQSDSISVWDRYASNGCTQISQQNITFSILQNCNQTHSFYYTYPTLNCSGDYLSLSITRIAERTGMNTFLKCQDTYLCFGVDYKDSKVCSGRGSCLYQDYCECKMGYNGIQCENDDLGSSGSFNLTSNIVSKTLTISPTTILNVFNQKLLFYNSSLNIKGHLNIYASTLNISSTKIHIEENGKLVITMNSTIIGDSKSSISSSGSIEITTGNSKTVILVPIINSGVIEITGNGTLNFTNSLIQSPSGTLNSLTSNIQVNGSLTIEEGKMNLGGVIESPTVNLQNGVVKVPNGLNITGNLNLNSLIIFEVNSTENLVKLLTTLEFRLWSTIIIKLTIDFVPSLGAQINIIPEATKFIIQGRIILIGTSGKRFLFPTIDPVNDGDIKTERLSLTVANSIYNENGICHYLGKGKNIEYFEIGKQYYSLSLILPIPRDDINFGLGWSSNSTFNDSLFVLFSNNTIQLKSSLNIIDHTFRKVPQLFGVGPRYFYINIIIPKEYIENQTYIFYVETTKDLKNLTDLLIESFQFKVGRDKNKECTNFIFPFRAEIYNLGSTIFLLFVYVILFIIAFVFWILRAQPLLSRGISPFFILFFLFANLLTEIRSFYYVPNEQASLCLFYSYLYYPSLQTCFIIILFYYIRYFMIINMNETKNSIHGSAKESIEIAKKKIFRIKLFLSKWTILFYLVFSFGFVNGVFSLVLASNLYECSYRVLIVLKVLNTFQLVFVYVLIISAIAFDMIANYKKLLTCKIINFLFYSDPYWFKSQIIIFLFFLFYQLFADIYIFVKTLSYVKQMDNYYRVAVINSISCAFILIIDVIFPLIVTFLSFIHLHFDIKCQQKCLKISFRRKSPDTESQLIHLLHDLQGITLFEEFCKSEFSAENIMCYKDIEKYKEHPTEVLAQEIYSTYLSGSKSPMEINVPKSFCSAVKDLIDKKKVENELFKQVEEGVIVNLSDTFFRFQESPSYKEYQFRVHTQKELLEMEEEHQETKKTEN